MGSGSPTATLYLYSEMNLNESGEWYLREHGSNNSLGHGLIDSRWVLYLFIESDEAPHLNNGNLSLPAEARTNCLDGSVGAILPLPIGANEEDVAADDHSTVVDATKFDFLGELLLNLDVPWIFETFGLRDHRGERHRCRASAGSPEDKSLDNTWGLCVRVSREAADHKLVLRTVNPFGFRCRRGMAGEINRCLEMIGEQARAGVLA